MRVLVLGGTVFLSRATAAHAVARGHEVTCAARGSSGEPPDGTTFVRVDRDEPDGLASLAGRDFDAVIDVARQPTQVRRAVAALSEGVKHWTFVSTISVYTDQATPGQSVETGPVHEPLAAGADEADMENYGPAKVSCEQAVTEALGDRAAVLRAGLIVGPGDPSDRFTYWPLRLARGGEVLAPGAPEEAVQMIDVRDLAAWIVRCAEEGVVGTFDATSPAYSRAEMLASVGAGVGVEPELTWVDQDFLADQQVNEWSGPRSLPLWVPLPRYAGHLSHDVSSALAAGLVLRDLEETARDTLAGARETGRDQQPLQAGLSAAEEADVLAAWRSRPA